MGRQKEGKEAIRSLTRMGGGRSLGLTLPVQFVHELGLRPKQKVKVTKQSGKLVISKHEK